MPTYPLGKLPADHLARLLNRYAPADPRLLVGGQVGQDAAVIDMGDRYLVAKTDPITFAAAEIGWYAVNVNANDIACAGATPKWFLATILLPEAKTTPHMVDTIFGQIIAACETLNITLAGGHTEITHGLKRPIIAGQMLGEVAKDKLVLTGGAQPGDDLLLTKAIAIEGTAIIAYEKRAELAGQYSPQKLAGLANLLHTPGISVVPEAAAAVAVGGVHAMHDPTEGGLATGLQEVAAAAGVGLEIFADTLPRHPDCLALCRRFGLDPLGLIASGALLLATAPQATPRIEQAITALGIAVTRIGRVHPPDFGLKLVGQAQTTPLPTFPRDEITKLFE